MIKVFKFAWQMPPIETFLNNLTYPEIWSVGCQGKQCKKRVSVRKMRKQKRSSTYFTMTTLESWISVITANVIVRRV